MSLTDEIDRLTKLPGRSWFADGLGELSAGGIFLVLGCLFILQETVEHPLLRIASAALIVAAPLLIRRLHEKLKERLVYPRGGYVRQRAVAKGRRLGFMILCPLILLMVIVCYRVGSLDTTLLAAGLFTALLLGSEARRSGTSRLYLLAPLAVLLAITIAILQVDELLNLGLFFAGYGLIMLASGAYALRAYWRAAPPQESAEDA